MRDVRKAITSTIFTEPFSTEHRLHTAFIRFIQKHIPLDLTKDHIHIGLQFWVEWQNMTQNMSKWSYRLEDLFSPSSSVDIVQRLFREAGMQAPSPATIINAVENNQKPINTRSHRKVLDIVGGHF